MKIFVIDDDPFALHLVSHQLRALGFRQISVFERARDAVEELDRDPAAASLILLDLQMPDMDGIEVVRHLAQQHYDGGLILVSGEDQRVLATASAVARARALDVRGFITKPVTPDQLRRVIEAPAHRSAPRIPRKRYEPEEIQRAIANNELVNHYQPKVEFATGRVTGVEALVRWQHPVDGLVFPEQFVGVAEEHRLIDPLTRAVLRGALAQAREWQDDGLILTVAVNVSVDNLVALDFPDFIERAVREAGVSNKQLVLEVTETRLMTNVLLALDILTRLRLKHISLSIDDFGTGHSSLAQLRNIPFDELKIDRGFVHGANRDTSAHAILEASLGVARQLGLKTVAEGVETLSDWQLMQSLNCDVAQGYFVTRPIPVEAFASWHIAWDKRVSSLVPS
ncbi:MAG: EAL domain-containing response regulator [Gemmatimonadetes bacterium]|nr:EAL domain-containing response regulator [Gemmatimonadota bacterium]